MVFPQTPLPIQVDFSLDGTTWTDVTSDVRSEQEIRITRGRSDWGQQVDAGRCSLSLSNTDGKYSPRNPESVYYGQIGRNTPVRVLVNTGSVALDLPGEVGDYSSTPDAAALDITGDIDIRFDATLVNWVQPEYPQTGESSFPQTELIGKAASSDVSWRLLTQQGVLVFQWVTSGLGTGSASSDVLPLTASGRLAVRVTLDVDNGSSQHVITFYTSDSISGTWTQLGNTVTGSGTTNIRNSGAALRIGAIEDLTGTVYHPSIGRVHAVQVLDGIGGTAAANPYFTAQSSGTTSFADAAGRTWTLSGDAEITNRKVRFVGEVASWTPRWETGGFDVITEVEAVGVMRRLSQGVVPLKSPVFRAYTNATATSIVAYWPMEDGENATELASALDGHPAVSFTQDVTPAAYSDWVGSDAIPTVTTGELQVTVPEYTLSSINTANVLLFFKVPAAGVVSTQRLLWFSQSGSATYWDIQVNTSGNLKLRAFDNEGTNILDTGFGSDSVNGLEKVLTLTLTQDGADIDYTLNVYDIADSFATAVPDDTLTFFTVSGTLSAYTTGRVTKFRLCRDGAMNSTAIGHLVLGNITSSFTATAGALVGWNAETASSRTARLGREESIGAYATRQGDEQCGTQARNTALDLMSSAGEVDEGIVAEQRPILGIRHVNRASLYNQAVDLSLNYTGDDGLVAPLDPADDDQSVTNDVTVTRDGGSSSRAVLDSGTLSTQAPPDGIGLYDTAHALNLLDDTQPLHHAGWRLHLGTWDETRFPQVVVNLAGASGSIEDAAAADVGSRIQITNPPVWLPPDTLDLMVQGYSETLAQFTWTIVYNCTPYGPFNIATEGDSSFDRADTDGSGLTEALTTTETDVDVLTTSGPVWTTTGSEYPFDVRVGGEVMSVTACTHGLSDDFSAAQVDSWGTADVGGTWTNAGGVAGNFDVAGGVGTHTLTTVSVSRRSTLTAPSASFDIYCDIATDQLATGGSLFGAIMARYVDIDNMYMARLELTTSNTIILAIRERAAGVEATLGTAVTLRLTHVAGTYYRVRFQGSGTALRAKAWLTTELEPGPWQVDTTDGTLTGAGSDGCRSIADGANTNVNPIVSYDNFNLVNPQTMTVTRSVNGVVKTHTSGTDVRLAYPASAPL